MFGWKFWAFVVGAAPLESELESFWSELGYVVVQGYGLTETAPIVTLNHPFKTSKGSVGTPIAGVEVRIADDGEILVRGENVTSGYYRPSDPESRIPHTEISSLHVKVDSTNREGALLLLGRIGELCGNFQDIAAWSEGIAESYANNRKVVDHITVTGRGNAPVAPATPPPASQSSNPQGASANPATPATPQSNQSTQPGKKPVNQGDQSQTVPQR